VRDNWGRYQATGVEVVGINTDSSEKHQRFADHHQLPLRLLADTAGEVVRSLPDEKFFGHKAWRGRN
jgi:peroxiredoxin Q/BCP